MAISSRPSSILRVSDTFRLSHHSPITDATTTTPRRPLHQHKRVRIGQARPRIYSRPASIRSCRHDTCATRPTPSESRARLSLTTHPHHHQNHHGIHERRPRHHGSSARRGTPKTASREKAEDGAAQTADKYVIFRLLGGRVRVSSWTIRGLTLGGNLYSWYQPRSTSSVWRACAARGGG